MEKIETIYYDGELNIMFKEQNFVSEAPLKDDWIRWHTLDFKVDERKFNFDEKRLEIYCHED